MGWRVFLLRAGRRRESCEITAHGHRFSDERWSGGRLAASVELIQLDIRIRIVWGFDMATLGDIACFF